MSENIDALSLGKGRSIVAKRRGVCPVLLLSWLGMVSVSIAAWASLFFFVRWLL